MTESVHEKEEARAAGRDQAGASTKAAKTEGRVWFRV